MSSKEIPIGVRVGPIDDPQHEHRRDFFLLVLRIFRSGARGKLMPVRRSLLAVRIRSTGQPRPSLWQPSKIVASVERRISNPTFQSSVDQMEPHFDVTQGQRRCGIDRTPQENMPSCRALPLNQFPSELRHFWCPIGEVGDTRGVQLPTSSNNCSWANEVFKE